MAAPLEILTRIQKVDLLKEAGDAINATSFVAEDLITDQLRRGTRSDGTELPDYSRVSVDVYGKDPGPIKLKDTGAFYQGIKVTAAGQVIDYTSTDSKTDDLELRYSTGRGSILKLSEESRAEYFLDLRPEFVDSIRKKLFT